MSNEGDNHKNDKEFADKDGDKSGDKRSLARIREQKNLRVVNHPVAARQVVGPGEEETLAAGDIHLVILARIPA